MQTAHNAIEPGPGQQKEILYLDLNPRACPGGRQRSLHTEVASTKTQQNHAQGSRKGTLQATRIHCAALAVTSSRNARYSSRDEHVERSLASFQSSRQVVPAQMHLFYTAFRALWMNSMRVQGQPCSGFRSSSAGRDALGLKTNFKG